MYIKFLLTIVAICSVAFIYYEYKPNIVMSYIPEMIAKQSNKPNIDPRCDSNYFTEKGKNKFCN